MGYYISMVDGTFRVPENDIVLQVLKNLNHDPNASKGGGSRDSDGTRREWFSWMDENYDQHVTSVAEVFTLLDFDVEGPDADGYISLIGYDSKIGDEEQFLAAVAQYADPASWIEWRGEDGAMWRHLIVDGVLTTQNPTITWS